MPHAATTPDYVSAMYYATTMLLYYVRDVCVVLS